MISIRLIAASAFIGAASMPAAALAQEYVIPQIWGNNLLGQSAMSHTRETILKPDDETDGDRRSQRRSSTECSVEALPDADRRAMEREYARRLREDGRTHADLWVREQGRLFRERLTEQGVC